ncbi:MAG: DUF1365 domain-containing protein [Gammaproteobacteria bacterium]|nr:DUF1365 domain-containing protein [Gammaproteobacteria bacterium]
MQSCIYEGQVRHTRRSPVRNRFRYRIFMMYLDLAELPGVFERRLLWSTQRSALARFRRSDHYGPQQQSLDESIRELVERETGTRPSGAIRLLTNLSYFGYCFNPVSFYYCYDKSTQRLETIVTEVNNTPWGERDMHVLSCSAADDNAVPLRFQPKKNMHVSPFMPMDVDYDWRFTTPLDQMNVYMANYKHGEKFFDVSMRLQRKEISAGSLARVLLRFPFMTFKVVRAIYWQALKLWLKRCPFYVHPDKKNPMTVQSR